LGFDSSGAVAGPSAAVTTGPRLDPSPSDTRASLVAVSRHRPPRRHAIDSSVRFRNRGKNNHPPSTITKLNFQNFGGHSSNPPQRSRKGFGVIILYLSLRNSRSVHFGLYNVERERERKIKKRTGYRQNHANGGGQSKQATIYSHFLIAGDGRKGISFAPEISRPVYSPRETKNK
jgi:hypothetical protein